MAQPPPAGIPGRVGIQSTVQPRVVWAGEGHLQMERPQPPVWLLKAPRYMEEDIKKGAALPADQVDRIRRCLHSLADKA